MRTRPSKLNVLFFTLTVQIISFSSFAEDIEFGQVFDHLRYCASYESFCLTDEELSTIVDFDKLQTAFEHIAPAQHSSDDKPFLMAIEDYFSLDEGTLVTGIVERGVLHPGEALTIYGMMAPDEDPVKTTCIEIQSLFSTRSTAKEGDVVGLLIKGVDKSQVATGQVIAAPNSISEHTSFKAVVNFLHTEEDKLIPPADYKHPQFYFRTADVSGDVTLLDGGVEVRTGDTLSLKVDLKNKMALEENLTFAIRRGGRTLGFGRIEEIIE